MFLQRELGNWGLPLCLSPHCGALDLGVSGFVCRAEGGEVFAWLPYREGDSSPSVQWVNQREMELVTFLRRRAEQFIPYLQAEVSHVLGIRGIKRESLEEVTVGTPM